jgi:hypothetical protein
MKVVLDRKKGKTPCFTIDRTAQTWAQIIVLQHVSGDYFLAHGDSTLAPNSVMKTVFPAEFVIGKSGKAERFGARMEDTMGEEKIWFERAKDEKT